MSWFFSVLIIVFSGVIILLFGFLLELLNPSIFDVLLIKFAQYTKINKPQYQAIFFFLTILVLLFIIFSIHFWFLPYVDQNNNSSLIKRIVLYIAAILISLFMLFSFTLSIIMSFKVILNILMSFLNTNDITLNLIDIKTLRNAIYKLSSYDNYSYISNDNWNLIWESILSSINNTDIIYLKNNLYNQYNSLIDILDSTNFNYLLIILKNTDLNNIAKVKEILNSNNVLQNLNSICLKLENLNSLFINLKNKLNPTEINAICNFLPLFNKQINFDDFLSNLHVLNIKANVILNVSLDSDNNVIFNTNIATLLYSFMTGLYVNSLQGLFNIINVYGNLIIANCNNLKSLVVIFVTNLIFNIFIIYLMRKLINDFVISTKKFFIKIFKRPKRLMTKENYNSTYFTEWYEGILKFLLKYLFIIYLDFLMTILILFITKFISISNFDLYNDFKLNKYMLSRLFLCLFLYLSTILPDIIFKCIKRYFEIQTTKQIIKEYNQAKDKREEISKQFSRGTYYKRYKEDKCCL